jgi:hypothetical protein
MRKVRHRSSQTGRQVTKEFADANPDTTVAETPHRGPQTQDQAVMMIRYILKRFHLSNGRDR